MNKIKETPEMLIYRLSKMSEQKREASQLHSDSNCRHTFIDKWVLDGAEAPPRFLKDIAHGAQHTTAYDVHIVEVSTPKLKNLFTAVNFTYHTQKRNEARVTKIQIK